MKFKNKDKKTTKQEETSRNKNDIQIVMGDDSNLDISNVENYADGLRPRKQADKKKLVIPKMKKKK